MLCRVLLTAIIATYVLCVLWLNGIQKEDLDVNMLRKLQRHNVNIDDIGDVNKLHQQCLNKSTNYDYLNGTLANDNDNQTSTMKTYSTVNESNIVSGTKQTIKMSDLELAVQHILNKQKNKKTNVDKINNSQINEAESNNNIQRSFMIDNNNNRTTTLSREEAVDNLEHRSTSTTPEFSLNNINFNDTLIKSHETTNGTNLHEVEHISRVIAEYITRKRKIPTQLLSINRPLETDNAFREIETFNVPTSPKEQYIFSRQVVTNDRKRKPNIKRDNRQRNNYRSKKLFHERPSNVSTVKHKFNFNVTRQFTKHKTNLPEYTQLRNYPLVIYDEYDDSNSGSSSENKQKQKKSELNNFTEIGYDTEINDMKTDEQSNEKTEHDCVNQQNLTIVPEDMFKEITETINSIISKYLQKGPPPSTMASAVKTKVLETPGMSTATTKQEHINHEMSKMYENIKEMYQQLRSVKTNPVATVTTATRVSETPQISTTAHKQDKMNDQGASEMYKNLKEMYQQLNSMKRTISPTINTTPTEVPESSTATTERNQIKISEASEMYKNLRDMYQQLQAMKENPSPTITATTTEIPKTSTTTVKGQIKLNEASDLYKGLRDMYYQLKSMRGNPTYTVIPASTGIFRTTRQQSRPNHEVSEMLKNLKEMYQQIEFMRKKPSSITTLREMSTAPRKRDELNLHDESSDERSDGYYRKIYQRLRLTTDNPSYTVTAASTEIPKILTASSAIPKQYQNNNEASKILKRLVDMYRQLQSTTESTSPATTTISTTTTTTTKKCVTTPKQDKTKLNEASDILRSLKEIYQELQSTKEISTSTEISTTKEIHRTTLKKNQVKLNEASEILKSLKEMYQELQSTREMSTSTEFTTTEVTESPETSTTSSKQDHKLHEASKIFNNLKELYRQLRSMRNHSNRTPLMYATTPLATTITKASKIPATIPKQDHIKSDETYEMLENLKEMYREMRAMREKSTVVTTTREIPRTTPKQYQIKKLHETVEIFGNLRDLYKNFQAMREDPEKLTNPHYQYSPINMYPPGVPPINPATERSNDYENGNPVNMTDFQVLSSLNAFMTKIQQNRFNEFAVPLENYQQRYGSPIMQNLGPFRNVNNNIITSFTKTPKNPPIVQTNLNEIPPIGVPVLEPVKLVHQNLFVTAERPFSNLNNGDPWSFTNTDNVENNRKEPRIHKLSNIRVTNSNYWPANRDLGSKALNSYRLKELKYGNRGKYRDDVKFEMQKGGTQYYGKEIDSQEAQSPSRISLNNPKKFHEILEAPEDDFSRNLKETSIEADNFRSDKVVPRYQLPMNDMKNDYKTVQSIIKSQNKMNSFLETMLDGEGRHEVEDVVSI